MIPVEFPLSVMYHVTPRSNVESIMAEGLKTSFYGTVHGEMEVRPPRAAIYLSRKSLSDNLNTRLSQMEPLVVMQIDARKLDPSEVWPDDFLYDLFAEGDRLSNVHEVAQAFGLDKPAASALLKRLDRASSKDLPLLLQACWPWYLQLDQGGEVAYTADIPKALITGCFEYDLVQARALQARLVARMAP